MDPGFREHGAAHLAGPQRKRGVLERLLHLPCNPKFHKKNWDLGCFPRKTLGFGRGKGGLILGVCPAGLMPDGILCHKGKEKNTFREVSA